LVCKSGIQEVALKHRAKLFDGKSSKDHEVFEGAFFGNAENASKRIPKTKGILT